MSFPWLEAVWDRLQWPRRVPSALLLTGPRGIGKGVLADALAQALLCRNPSGDDRACGQCADCRLFVAGVHPDRILLEPSAQEDKDGAEVSGEGTQPERTGPDRRWIRVDEIRELRARLALAAHYGRRRVVSVRPADRLHPNAANALLKILEEPPHSTHFVLVTARPGRLPATVRSRCVRVEIPQPEPAVSRAWLRQQGVAEPDAALAYAGFVPLAALEMSGSVLWAERGRLIQVLREASKLHPARVSENIRPETLPALFGALQRWCYDLLLLKSAGTVRYNPDQAQVLLDLAGRIKRQALLDYLRELAFIARALEHPLNPRLVAERCLIGYRKMVTATSSTG